MRLGRVGVGEFLARSEGLIDGRHTRTAHISTQADFGTHSLRLRNLLWFTKSGISLRTSWHGATDRRLLTIKPTALTLSRLKSTELFCEKMTERPQSPTGADCRPYEVNRAMYPQAPGLDGLGGASLQFAHGMLQDPSLLFNKAHFNGISSATHQTFFPFSGEFKTNDLQGNDFAQPKHWYPFAAPEFTGQVAGATTATQPANISPPIAETREQIKIPAEVKTEKDVDEYTNEENKPTSQYNFTPGTSSVPTGVNYYTPWNPSFWPGLPHITAPANISQAPPTPSTSSSSLSPSPPGNGFGSPGFFNGGSAQNIPSGQGQSAPRSSGSSSGGCSDSEEEVRFLT